MELKLKGVPASVTAILAVVVMSKAVVFRNTIEGAGLPKSTSANQLPDRGVTVNPDSVKLVNGEQLARVMPQVPGSPLKSTVVAPTPVDHPPTRTAMTQRKFKNRGLLAFVGISCPPARKRLINPITGQNARISELPSSAT